MTHRLLLLLFLCFLISCSQTEHPSEYADIPDENLAEVLRYELKLDSFEPIPKKQLSDLTELVIPAQREIENLKGLEHATGLIELTIHANYKIKDISPLSNLTNLKELAIYGNEVKNIKPLSKLTQLTKLWLDDNRISNIKPIAELTNLTELWIGENPITDLVPLANLQNLSILGIGEIPIADITPLKELTQLTKLTLGNNHLSDISLLANLSKLTKLNLYDNHISDISSLSGLTNLTELTIFHNQVKDISPLADLTNLTTLKLHNSFSDIAPLARLTNLVKLELYGNRITDISSLSKLTQLTKLRLEGNIISDISPLAELTNLTTLRLHNNQISDIEPLSDMNELLLLELHRNQIRDVTPLSGMTKLKGLFLGGNEVADITPLAGLIELTHLGLAHNDIKDIRVVDNFKLLEHLSVGQNPIRDFSPLNRLREHNPELHQPTRNRHYRETPELGTVFARHETRTGLPINALTRLGKGGINVIQFSPDGAQLFVGTDIGVRIYEVTTGNEKEIVSKINAEVNALAFSHNGRILATGGASNPAIQLWDMHTGNAFPPIPVTSNSRINSKPIRSVSAFAFSKDDTTLISLNGNGLINFWDITQSNNIPKVETYTFGDGDTYALKYDGSMFATGTIDGKIEIWNTSGGEIKFWEINRLKQTKPITTLMGHSRLRGNFKLFGNKNKPREYSEIIALAFSSDGVTLASGSKDMTVRLWDTTRRKRLNTLEGHTGWVTSVAFSRDGKTLASGDSEGILRLWNTENGKELATLNGHGNTIVALTFSPDGKTLASASADGTIRFWDANSGDDISVFATGHTESVKAVAFSADGSSLSCAMFNGTVKNYDTKTYKELSTFTANHQNLTEAVVLSSDASLLASQGIDGRIAFNVKGLEIEKKYYSNRKEGSIKLWNLITGEELATLPGSYNMSFSPNNKIFATRTYQQIGLWHVRKGVNLSPILFDGKFFLFTPDSANLVISGGSFHDESVILDLETRQILGTLDGNHNPVAFSSDGTILACKKSYDYFFWDLTIPKEPRLIGDGDASFSTLNRRTVTLSPDGTIFLEAHYRLHDWFCEAQIQLWDVETGNRLLTLYGHTEPINTLAFSPDRKTFASGSEDGTVILWDWDNILNDVRLTNRWPDDR